MGKDFDDYRSYGPYPARQFNEEFGIHGYHIRHRGPRTTFGQTVAIAAAFALVVVVVALVVLGHLAK